MTFIRYAALTFLIVLTACSHRVPTSTVLVIDTSLSITPRAEEAVENAAREAISRMGRGDRLVLIPVTGDAEDSAGGHILRLVAPTVREPYDMDLRRFQTEARKQFAAWIASLNFCEMRTDILGTLDLARQELAAMPSGSKKQLVVVSDFLEDESAYRFVSALELRTPVRARALAVKLRADRHFSISGIPVCLGRLESGDYAALTPARKEAVRVFWDEYLGDRGRAPLLRFDVAGMLASNDCLTSQQDGQAQ